MNQTDLPVAEEVASKLAEWELNLNPEMPYQLDKMFPKLAGWGVKTEIKRRVKLIREVEPRLESMLLPNEQVLYVAKGIQSSVFEAITIGAMWSNMINQTVFVLTNVRLLMAHCNRKGQTSEPCWMIYYSEIKSFKGNWTGRLDLKLNDGTCYRFTGFPKIDRKTMPVIFEQAIQLYKEHGFEPACSQSRENACSHCFAIVPKATHDCPECGATFWTSSQIALRSLLFPAWGDLLMKHYPLAIMEIIGYMISWVIALDLASNGNIIAAIIVIACSHMIDSVVTLLISSKGLHTKRAPLASSEPVAGLDPQ